MILELCEANIEAVVPKSRGLPEKDAILYFI